MAVIGLAENVIAPNGDTIDQGGDSPLRSRLNPGIGSGRPRSAARRIV
jgi:hypothetical protein